MPVDSTSRGAGAEPLATSHDDLLNALRVGSREPCHTREESVGSDAKGGDEGDQTLRALAESEFLSMHERLRKQLMEIESALSRIDKGLYGVCEETEEPIEAERLLAIPWTRLSIEGAEIRESLGKKYAR